MAQKDRDNPNHPRAVTPPLSQRVGERLPLAQAGFALTEAMRVPIYYPCDRCRGQGTVEPVGNIICRSCRQVWSQQDVERASGHHWRKRLPCGCAMEHGEVTYSYPPCPSCGGDGWLHVLVTLADALDWLESLYATISQQTTARHLEQSRATG